MRNLVILASVALISAAPAMAQERYVNARYGFSFEIPVGFETSGPEAANGDGRAFVSSIGNAELVAFAGNVTSGSFASEVSQYKGFTRDDGWRLTYEAGGNSWAVYSGTRGAKILYSRFERQCDGRQFAAVQVTYDAAAKERLDPLIEDLARSLEPGECG